MIRFASFKSPVGCGLLTALLVTSTPVCAAPPPQGADDDEPPAAVSHAVVEPTGPSASRALNDALVRLGRDPRNVDALLAAGYAAIALGDNEAGLGFFTRANQIAPADAAAKAAIAGARLHLDDPVEALRWYAQAEQAGADPTLFALDRGLAYDLVGDNAAAVLQYRKVLERASDPALRDEATRREAMSLAIGGDRRSADLLLLPLLQRQDRAAWRVHIFVAAVAGRSDEAVGVARATMPADLAASISPYLRFMPRLTPAQQAAVVSQGRFPRAADIGRDDPRVVTYTAAHPRVPLVPAVALAQAKPAVTPSQAAKAVHDRRHRGQAPVAVAAAAPTAEADIVLPAPPPLSALAAANAPPFAPTASRTTTHARAGFDLAQVAGTSTTRSTEVVQPIPPRTAPAISPPISPVVPHPTVLSRLDMPPPGRTPLSAQARVAAPARPATTAMPAFTAQAMVEPTPASAPAPVPALAPVPVASSQPDIAPVAAAPSPAMQPAVPTVDTAATPGIVAIELPASGAPTPMVEPVPTSHAVVETAHVDKPAVARAPAKAAPPKPVPTPSEPAKASKPTKLAEETDKSKSAKDRHAKAGKDKPAEATDEDDPHAEKDKLADKAGRAKAAHGKQARDDAGDAALAPCPPAEPVRSRKGKAALAKRDRARLATRTRHGAKDKKAARDSGDSDTCAAAARGDRPDGPAEVSRDSDSEDSHVTKGKAKGHDKNADRDTEKTSAKPEKGGRKARYESRIWVEVLTGNDRDKMPGEWRNLLRKAHPLKGHKPYITPWHNNFRLLTGPFDSDADAQDFIAELRKDGVSGFEWTSPAGQAVDSLALHD